MTRPRRAFPATEKGVRKTVAAPILENGGKLKPAKLPSSGLDVKKRIVTRQQDGKTVYCVESETGGRKFGCYPTRQAANTRLAQIERFKETKKAAVEETTEVVKRLFIPILKQNVEEQTITGVVLQPEIVDAQGDIIGKDVIRKAAHKFLSAFNKQTKLGLMHKDFQARFDLYESYIVPMELVIGDKLVKAGSWVITVHVKDKNVWKQVKDGKLTGFSIAGKAKVLKVEQPKQVA